MRFLLFLFILVSQAGNSQEINRAVFEKCKGMDDPYECTDQKFAADMQKLVSGKITDDLRKSKDSAYFSINLAFISDEIGHVVNGTVQVACDNTLLKAAINNYITTLPLFYPKRNSDAERRTVHFYDYTFVFSKKHQNYQIASDDELKASKIKANYVMFITPPLLKECSGSDDAYECTKQKLYKLVAKTYSIPKFEGPDRAVKLNATYMIEKDGSLTVKDITCSEDNKAMIEEYRRVLLEELPPFLPGNYKDVAVKTTYSLPVTINLYN
jgi:hypothetical protein